MEAPEIKVVLKDGTNAYLRAIGVCDKQCITDAFENLSDRSRYSRYHTPIRKLPDCYIESLLHADNVNNVVIVAHLSESESHEGLGLARYVRLEDDPDKAEFSLTIVDDYQGKGLGSLMFNYLVEHARNNNVSALVGYVLASNESMIRVLKRYNSTGHRESDGTVCYEVDVRADVSAPASPA